MSKSYAGAGWSKCIGAMGIGGKRRRSEMQGGTGGKREGEKRVISKWSVVPKWKGIEISERSGVRGRSEERQD